MRSDDACRGLCTICRNAPDCTFLRDLDKPVTQCEEFVCDGPLPPRAAPRKIAHEIISEERSDR